MLIVISNPTPVEQEHKIINALFDEGLSIFHLRKLNYSRKELNHLLVKINKQHHSKIAFHQHHELADYFGSTRLHYTEQERKLNQQQIDSNDMSRYTLSTSIHHVNAYASLSEAFSYCFLAPVFNSISKPDHLSIVTPDFKLPVKSTIKIIALGGISSTGIPDIKKYDFDGIAVLGTIWKEPEAGVENFKKLKLEWDI